MTQGGIPHDQRLEPNGTYKVVILRGIPGAGKTTYIRHNLPDAFVVSADHYFERGDSRYCFNKAELSHAHQSALARFRSAIDHRLPLVAVDNTHTRVHEFMPYADYAIARGYRIRVIRLVIDPNIAVLRNVHNVPAETVFRMHRHFETFAGEKAVLADTCKAA